MEKEKNNNYKNIIRQSKLDILMNISNKESLQKGASLSKILINNIKENDNIGIFLSFKGEISTRPIIEKLWELNKKIYIPLVNYNNLNMNFFRYKKSSICKLSKWQVVEPIPSLEDKVEIKNLEVLILPLVAFDKNGNRLGRGKGYYDCVLRQLKNKISIGIAYDWQKVDHIPIDSWDMPLRFVCTPTRWIQFK